MTYHEMRDARTRLKERIHDALATRDKQKANDLLIEYSELHWRIRDLEELEAAK